MAASSVRGIRQAAKVCAVLAALRHDERIAIMSRTLMLRRIPKAERGLAASRTSGVMQHGNASELFRQLLGSEFPNGRRGRRRAGRTIRPKPARSR